MKRFCAILLAVLSIGSAFACTSVIASGKVTADGRPFIFKNRDSSNGIDNSMITLKGTKYRYVGVVNYSTSSSPQSIWYGHNEAGFAILNTVSYYFNSATSSSNTSAGSLMKKALGECATVDEFEALLHQTQQESMSLVLSTNFAVMDSLGNVAYFETSNRSYTKFDVNDETVAPNGYLVRTNYSFTSPYYETTNHVGEQRYKAAHKYIEDTFGGGKIDAVKLVHELPRYLYHGDREVNLWDDMPENYKDVRNTYFSNFIPRFTSTSASLMQGVKENEPAKTTVSWIAMGWPCGSFTVPIVITPSLVFPDVVERDASTHKSEMCTGSVELKNKVFNIYYDGSQKTDSIDLSKLINKQETGILQKVMAADELVCEQGLQMLDNFRTGTATDQDVAAYYEWVDEKWREFYEDVITWGIDIPGDVNGDRVVSGADVTALYNVLLLNAVANGNADVNGDGVVSGSDVTALYNLLLQ
ncbi:MAG: dockerin type I repeat-containing protein [Muribaculaceae bacterium]|nr:dockerin type I repeat-containing protein [Muribaculaceae bacterium]